MQPTRPAHAVRQRLAQAPVARPPQRDAHARVARPPRRRGQRGTSLVEALIAFVVLSLGILALAHGQALLRLHADIARQRTEAVQFAQHDLETLRAYATLEPAPGLHAYAEIASGSGRRDAVDGGAGNASYRLQRHIDATVFSHAKAASLRVDWSDRRGETQQIVLQTIIAAAEPAHAAALGLEPRRRTLGGVLGRSAAIPLAARDLGNGTSAFKPLEAGHVALVFDNASGRLTQRCSGVAADITTPRLRLADLAGCTASGGHLLSGVVRFATGPGTPGAVRSAEAVLPLAVEIQLSDGRDGTASSCSSTALKTVAYEADGETRVITVPVDAAASAFGLGTWRDLGEHHVAYHCVVAARPDGRWSGRSVLRPIGWTLGNTAGAYRVCRHVADLDGSGAIDRNIEHPAVYTDVDGALPQQNFLVIDAGLSCPAAGSLKGGVPASVAGRGTLQHQP